MRRRVAALGGLEGDAVAGRVPRWTSTASGTSPARSSPTASTSIP
ncbi:MAG TPA: hypothetical protein VHP56_05035 [Solirubrobacterales bacterium]|nr:hypothetical protein [Solirubrobacterales bacterium]